MNIFYSAQENRCYDGGSRAVYEDSGVWPDDAIEISNDLYAKTVINRPIDQVMMPGIDGLPVLVVAAPSSLHQWNGTGWVLSPAQQILLDAIERERLNVAISSWRDHQEQQPITFKHIGHDWDGGVKVKIRLDTVASLPALPADYFWTDANNNDVPMDLVGIKALRDAHEVAIATRGWQIHQRQRHMKTEIETLEGDALLNYKPDWPNTL